METDILNPDAASEFNPDYGFGGGLPDMMSIFQAVSGEVNARQLTGQGRKSVSRARIGTRGAPVLALRRTPSARPAR